MNFIKHFKNKYEASYPDNGSTPLEGEIKVIAIMGQSNIDQRADIAGLPPDIENPTSLVQFYADGKWNNWDYTAGQPMGYVTVSNKFAHDTIWLQRLAENLEETVYVAKESRSGTAFKQSDSFVGDWNVNSTDSNDHYLSFIKQLTNTKNYVEQVLLKNFKITVLVCDIFETDSDTSDVETLTTDFKAFIAKIREFADEPNLPIIQRELTIDQTYVSQWTIDLQNFFADNTAENGGIDNYHLLPGVGNTYFDGVHLDAASNERIANQVLPILLNIYNE